MLELCVSDRTATVAVGTGCAAQVSKQPNGHTFRVNHMVIESDIRVTDLTCLRMGVLSELVSWGSPELRDTVDEEGLSVSPTGLTNGLSKTRHLSLL